MSSFRLAREPAGHETKKGRPLAGQMALKPPAPHVQLRQDSPKAPGMPCGRYRDREPSPASTHSEKDPQRGRCHEPVAPQATATPTQRQMGRRLSPPHTRQRRPHAPPLPPPPACRRVSGRKELSFEAIFKPVKVELLKLESSWHRIQQAQPQPKIKIE